MLRITLLNRMYQKKTPYNVVLKGQFIGARGMCQVCRYGEHSGGGYLMFDAVGE